MPRRRFDAEKVDLSAFEAWLRSQLVGPMFASVLVVILQMMRALFEQNLQLRMRLLARRAKPPSELLAKVERQLSFSFVLPGNDVVPSTPSRPAEPSDPTPARADPAENPPRSKPQPRQPLPDHLLRIPVPNDVPAEQRMCETCHVPMTTVSCRAVEYLEMIPGRIVVHRRLDETIACPHCDAMVCAKAPPSVLDGGLLGPTLVTEALCNKVLDGMPVHLP